MKSDIFAYITLAVFVVVMTSIAVAAPVEDTPDAVSYLSKFGYLPPRDPDAPNALVADDSLKDAIKDYQAFMGLSETGQLDKETLAHMSKPRCGIMDKDPPTSSGVSNYKLGGSRWKKRTLTYKISSYPSRLSQSTTDAIIKEAFDKWSQVTPLRFVKRNSGLVHIEILFARGEHGDRDPFDGPRKVLAHASYPKGGGDAHFDDDENWTTDFSGTNLLQVVTHELGHSLGLDHTTRKGAVMYPTYQRINELHADDISAIQAVYN